MLQWDKLFSGWNIKTILVFLLPLFKAVAIFAVGHFLTVYIVRLIRRSLSHSKLDRLLVDLLCRVLRIALYVIIALSALTEVGVSTTGLLAAMSAVAAGIALALKDSLGNIAGGIVLLLSPRFSAGDLIHVNDEEGWVLEVGLMHTTIVTYNKRQVSIPNGVLVNSQISNLTRETIRRVDIDFPIPYGTDVEKARAAAVEILSACPLVITDEEHPIRAVVMRYQDSAVILSTRCWCQPKDYWEVYWHQSETLLAEMEKRGFVVPFNRLDVTLCPPDIKEV